MDLPNSASLCRLFGALFALSHANTDQSSLPVALKLKTSSNAAPHTYTTALANARPLGTYSITSRTKVAPSISRSLRNTNLLTCSAPMPSLSFGSRTHDKLDCSFSFLAIHPLSTTLTLSALLRLTSYVSLSDANAPSVPLPDSLPADPASSAVDLSRKPLARAPAPLLDDAPSTKRAKLLVVEGATRRKTQHKLKRRSTRRILPLVLTVLRRCRRREGASQTQGGLAISSQQSESPAPPNSNF